MHHQPSRRVVGTLALVTAVAGVALVAMTTPAEASSCFVYSDGDYAHISTTSSNRAVQGHGWWLKSTGTCPPTAIVKAAIQVKNVVAFTSWWTTVGTTGEATVTKGGGSGNRATGHYTCSGTRERHYRTIHTIRPNASNGAFWSWGPTPERLLACG